MNAHTNPKPGNVVRKCYPILYNMRIIKSCLLFLILLPICSCRGCFRNVSDSVIPSGGNPELISYLQGTWVLSANEKSVVQIKRDSITHFYNDSLKSAMNLSYVFAGTAESYYTKDSAFDFSSENGQALLTDEFKLIENGENPGDTISHFIAYVSKSRLVINTHGKFADFKRTK